VAARVGFCGLDRRREPLQGDEVRACWDDAAAEATDEPAGPGLLGLIAASSGVIGVPDAERPSAEGRARPSARPGSSTRRTGSPTSRDWVELEV
jgi:hypothetical protein